MLGEINLDPYQKNGSNMTKPTFIFFFGIGWAGTTSLYKTLDANLYLHPGCCKEPSFLTRLDPIGYSENKLPKPKIIRKKEVDYYREHYLIQANPFIDTLRNISTDWDAKIKDYKNFSLEDYINFYKEVSEYKNSYAAVGDFSNANELLSHNHLIHIKSLLDEHFTVKALSIHRDPVRRLFSVRNAQYYSSLLEKYTTDYSFKQKYNSATQYFLDNIKAASASNTLKIQQIFGKENTHNVIMEKFFIPDKDEVQLLEDFISYELPIITPCAFVPDRGINAPKLDDLKDQWDSDYEVLTPETYNIARKQLEEEYQRYEKIFGDRLPDTWGKPIDYGY